MTSPASSGGAGTHFEAKVAASYLLSMLLEVDARGLPGCRIHSVRLQRSQEGHPLDDVVIHGVDDAGDEAILDIQVKRLLTFTASDREFRDIVRQIGETASQDGFWGRSHHLAIAVARTKQSTEPSYQDALSWARHLEDAKTFHERLSRPGAANPAMRNFVAAFGENLKAAGFDHDPDVVWNLLRRVQILVYDFDSPDAPTTTLMRERAFRALENGTSSEATKLWSHLITLAEDAADVGGSKTRPQLAAELHAFQLAGSRNNRRALKAIFEEAESALAGFDEAVDGVCLLRQARVQAVQSAMKTSRYVEIRGQAGVGKSGLLKRIADLSSAQARSIVLTPNRGVGGGWLALRALTGYEGEGLDLMNELSLSGVTALFVDNLDFYSLEKQETVRDLIRFASQHPTMRVVVTARPEFGVVEPTWISRDALARLGTPVTVVLDELSAEEVEELRSSAPRLTSLLSERHPARHIVRNLFRLSRLVDRRESEVWPATEAEMARTWWILADGKGDAQLRDRLRFLVRMTRHALVSTELFSGATESAEVIEELKRSGTIQEYGTDRFAFRHDTLREWAFANLFFEDRGFSAVPHLQQRAAPDLARGAELAARLALADSQGVTRWRELLTFLDGSHETWRREVMLALVRSEDAEKLLMNAESLILANDAALFQELVRYTLAVEFESVARRMQERNLDKVDIPGTWKIPRNSSAAHLATWALVMAGQIPPTILPDVVKLFTTYTLGTFGADQLTKMILPSLFGWLTIIEADRDRDLYDRSAPVFSGAIEQSQLKIMEEECRTAFLFFCQRTPELAVKYLQSFKGKKYRDELRIDILKLRGALAQAAPKEFVDFALDTFIKKEPKRRQSRYEGLMDRPFEYIDTKFMPSSPSQGPFLDLLTHAPEEGLRLVRDLVRFNVQYERDAEHKDRGVMLVRNGKPETFAWSDFYMWARGYGNASGLVVSALMALEAWGHRRIDAGERVELVVNDIVADASCSSAVLLTAVDMLLSHWPESADTAVPFIGCPELLCMELGRPGREHIPDFDFFGLKNLQQEPVGPVNCDSLKQRPSRKVSLYDALTSITFGPPERCERVQALLRIASERLGTPKPHSDLGDPRFMALHALNVLDRANWVEIKDSDGNQTGMQYKAPKAEEAHMEPIRQRAAPRLEENALRMAILDELFTKAESTPSFLDEALLWAKKHQHVFDHRPEFDSDGRFLTMTEAVVTTATLLARNASTELLEKEGDWIRTMFERTYEDASDPVHLHRDGLRFNPPAIAFVGQVLLLHRSRRPGDEERLLRFACAVGYGAAHGFKATLPLLKQIDDRLIACLMRGAFEGAIQPDNAWDISDEQKSDRKTLIENRIATRIREELDWLSGHGMEPTWPVFPTKRARTRPPQRLGRDVRASNASTPSTKHLRVDYQRTALWLRQSRLLLGPTQPAWLGEMVETYLVWTQQANGYGGDKEERFERGPSEWNDVYFEAAARCMKHMTNKELDQRLNEFFDELPDEPLMAAITPFVRSADVGYLDFDTFSAAQLVHIRRFVIARLQTTRMFARNKDREEASVTSDIAPAFAAICFNNYYGGFAPAKCFVPAQLITKTDPFLQTLEDFVAICPSPFVAFLYLNFFEVAPHDDQLGCLLGCSEKWLAKFPESNQLWLEWGVGKRIIAVFTTLLRDCPEAFGSDAVRPRMDRFLSRLVGLGVNEAHELERSLYRSSV